MGILLVPCRDLTTAINSGNLGTADLTNQSARGGAVAARRAHNPEVAGSNPAPATKRKFSTSMVEVFLLMGQAFWFCDADSTQSKMLVAGSSYCQILDLYNK